MSENGFPYGSMTHPDGQQNPPPQRAPPGDGASGGGGSGSGSAQPMIFQEVAGRGAAFTSISDPAGVMLQQHQIQLAAATPPAASAAAAAAAAAVGVPTAVLHGGVHIPPLPNALLSGNGGSNGIGGMNPDLGEHVFPAHQLFHAAAAAAAAAAGDGGGGGTGGMPGPGKSAASTISEGVASAVTGGWFISEPGAGGEPGAAGVGDPVVIPVSLTPQELAARKEMISAETRKQLGVLQDLRAKHAGKRGRYNSADQRVKDDAERAMADLRVNIMPHERQAMSKPVADGGAKSGKKRKKSSNGKASRAGEAACGDPYLANGSGSAMGGCWEDEEEDKEDDDDDNDDDGDGEGEGEEGEGEDEGGTGDRSRDSATIPPHAKKRLQQIKLLCKRGYLSRAYSCVFYPKGPSASEVKAGAGAGGGARASPVGEAKGSGGGGGGGGLPAPVIYVEAPHMYYQGKVPKMPPCPRHGWQPEGEVESKGWTKGRRVSGVLEDAFLLGTKHVCKLCKQNRLALEESLMACPPAADDAERRRRKEILRKSSYVFRSYDPEVSRMYAQRYPWMASQTSSFVFTKKKAMTHELALLLRQMQGPGAPSAKSPRTAAEREIQVRQAIERVRQAQVALAAEIDAEHRAAMPALFQPAQVPPPPLPAAPAPAAPVGPGPVAPPPSPLPPQVSPAAAAAAAVWGAGAGAGAPPPPPMMQALASSATPPVPAFASSPSGGVGQPGVGGLAGGGPFLSPVLQLPQQQQQQQHQQQQEEQGSARAQPLPAVTTAMAPAFPFLQAAAVFPPPADVPPPSPTVPAPPAKAAAAAKATVTAGAVEAVAPGRGSDTLLSPVPSPEFSNLEPAPSIGSADAVGDAKETAAAWDMLPKHDNDNHLGLPERAPNSAGQPLPPTGTPTVPPVPAAVPAANGTETTVGGAAAPAAPGQGQAVREVVAPEGSTAQAGVGEGAGERSSNGTGGAGAAAVAALVQSPPPPPPPPQVQHQHQQQAAVPQALPTSLPVPSSSSSSSLSATPSVASADVGPWPSAEAGVAATATATTPVPPSA